MDSGAFLENFNHVKPADRSGYYLEEYLAEGGQAWIYTARHPEGPAAIKLFRQHQTETEVSEFITEGRKLKELSACDFIVQVKWLDSISIPFGGGRGKSMARYPYMAMELADGGSIKEHIGTDELTPERSLTWLTQAMEGIRYAHGEHFADGADEMSRVVHRDIKPANVLVVRGRAKVADFGIAVTGHKNDMTISRTQMRAGTYPYMSPEQFHGRAVLASDIYSMGVTGYQMVTGRLPINCRGGDYQDWYMAHQNVVPRCIDMRNPDGSFDELAMEMQQILIKGMAKHPKDRFATMGDFQRALVATASQPRDSISRHATHIDLAPSQNQSPASTEIYEMPARQTTKKQAEAMRTQLLTATFPETRALTKEAQIPERRGMSRRRLLAIGGVLGAASVEELGRRFLFSGEDNAEAPQTPHERIVSTTQWVIDQCKKLGRSNDVFYLVRDLLTVDSAAASTYIQEMPLTTASWLAADLAQYDPGAAEKVMKKYEAKHDYVSATRIALSLAYYGKEKLHEKSTGFISGVPVDPKRAAAYNAAARVKIQCNNQDLQDLIDLASRIDYSYSNFGKPVDLAAQKLEELRKADKPELVEMLCRVIARDAPSDVADCLTYYCGLATTAVTGKPHQEALQTTVNLATDLAPFAPDLVTATFDYLGARSEIDFRDAADAIAMALAPYKKAAVADYVSQADYTYSNRFPIGIAVNEKLPQLESHASGPMLSWLRFAQDPSAANAQKAQESLAGQNFKTYAYWVTAGLLKSQTVRQK